MLSWPAGGALLGPISDIKAHDKEVVGLCLVPVGEDPERTRVLLYSAGGCVDS